MPPSPSLSRLAKSPVQVGLTLGAKENLESHKINYVDSSITRMTL